MMQETVHRQGEVRGVKTVFPDGSMITFWYPLYTKELAAEFGVDPDTPGVAFDLRGEDLDDLIQLLRTLKEAEGDTYQPEEDEN